jgi:hypothetical protein
MPVVGREAPVSADQRFDERVLVVDLEERIRRPLAADRRTRDLHCRGEAERAGRVRGMKRGRVRERGEAAQTVKLGPGELLGAVRAEQVGSRRAAENERAAREDGFGSVRHPDRVRQVLGGVTRSRNGPDNDISNRKRFVGVDRAVGPPG